MKRFIGLVAAIPAALALSFSAAHAQSVRTKIDQYMKANVKVRHFMGAILVAKDGKILIAKGYGMANVKQHIPNTASTEFRIGSVTKQFTAMAILQLQAEGKLNVHDRICKYVPHCPKDWRPITITNLLDHTSGIPDIYSGSTEAGVLKVLMSRTMTPAQLLALFKNKPLEFKPGTRWKYSSSGYDVLGYVIRRVSGETYPQFLQQHIFRPLGMKSTTYDNTPPTAGNYAKGYDYSYSKNRLHPAKYLLNGYSAGALSSTVRDLYTWDRALEADKVLPQALQKQMFTPQARVKNGMLQELEYHGPVHYGFGWFIAKEFGHLTYSHEGGTLGFEAMNSWFPAQHVYVIILSNNSQSIFTMRRNLAAIVFGKTYTLPKLATVSSCMTLSANMLAAMRAGHFKAARINFNAGMQSSVSVEKLREIWQRMLPQKFGAFQNASAPHATVANGYREIITPLKFAKGRLNLQVGCNRQHQIAGLLFSTPDSPSAAAQRRENIKSEATTKSANPHKTAALSAKQLQRFVGTYQLAPNFSITITRHGNQLTEQATGQAAFPIYPKSKTEFFLKVVNAQISFMTNAKGKVTSLILHQAGHNMPAKKIK